MNREKLVKLKSELCVALLEDISNCERQKLKELFSLVDALILNKFSKVTIKDYNSMYKELTQKLVKNPNDNDIRLLLDRVKNYDVSEDGFIYIKLMQIKLVLQGYSNDATDKVVLLIDELNYQES